MNIADELEKLQQLHQRGGLSDQDYAKAKDALLSGRPNPAIPEIEQQTRQWAMFLHLSLLAGFIVPLAGLLVPILIWQLKKAELPGIDVHGKIVVNWIISLIIYGAISAVLILVLIGVPLLILLGVIAIVFPIIGGIKANNGEIWTYPGSIAFLK
jgi:uncharacterized Tic20 family protein